MDEVKIPKINGNYVNFKYSVQFIYLEITYWTRKEILKVHFITNSRDYKLLILLQYKFISKLRNKTIC
jgi:hypothetical protein